MVRIVVNGDATELAPESSVADLVTVLGLPDRGIAVAVDGELVPRGQWTKLLDNDSQVEVVTAVQGG